MHKAHFDEPRNALLTNANPSKENHGEDLVNRVDLNFTITVEREEVSQLFLEPEAMQQGLWDDDGRVRDGELSLALNSIAEQQVVTVGKHRFGESKVKLLSADPGPGWTVDIKLQAQVYPGSTKEGKQIIGQLCDWQKQEVPLSITNQQATIDDD